MPILPQSEVEEFRRQVEEDAQPRPRFYALIFLASTIATFGLLANSAAVIIGAMLVAPLMNSIVGVALGAIMNRRALLRRATFALVTGATLALATGAVLSGISPVPEPGSEILSRIRPTLFDLWVAAAAGLAGAYSLLRARQSAALPGVAIATALVPPLVTSGIELRLLHFPAAMGALLLFLSNMVAITCGGLAVFGYYGLGRYARQEPGYRPLRAYGAWSTAFVVVGLVLGNSLSQVVREARTHQTIQRTLSSQLRMVRGASVDRFDLTESGTALTVRALVATPQSIGPPIVAAAERLLGQRLHRPVKLVIRSVLTKDADARTYLQEEPSPPAAAPLVVVERILREQEGALPDAHLVDFNVGRAGGGFHVRATYRTPAPLDPLLVRGIRNLLTEALGAPVELKVQSGRESPPDGVPLPTQPRSRPEQPAPVAPAPSS